MRRALAVPGSIALATLFVLPAFAQSVEEIVAKNLKAKGGLDLLHQTDSVKMSGTFTTYQPTRTAMPMTTWAKRPNFVRREVEVVPPPGLAQPVPARPTKMVSAADGSTVWMQQGSGPPIELPASQAAQVLRDNEFDSVFVDYRDKAVTIDLVGVEKVNGRDAYHLAVRRKGGPVQHYFLDQETGLEARVTTDVSQGGSTATITTELSDYRDVDGRMVPFRMRQLVNGEPQAEMAIDHVEFNVAIPDSLFSPPRH